MYHYHLIAAAAQKPLAISPGTARALGYGLLALGILWILNSVFGRRGSSN